MPFDFFKKKKPEKEKAVVPPAKVPEKPGSMPASAPVKGEPPKEAPKSPAAPAALAAPAPEAATTPPAQPTAADLDAAVSEVHAGLVDLGLTIPGTKAVFAKRVTAFPDGAGAFVALYRDKPYRAGTAILVDWLGLRAPADFDPETLLADVNLRLSSFKLAIQMSDVTWLDEELGLRKARLRLAEIEKVVRFKDARDFIKCVNDLIASKKLAFLELETWTPDFAFLLVREPRWDKLAATKLVTVKAPQTATGGECGECGAPVGENWNDCLSCGAVFGSD